MYILDLFTHPMAIDVNQTALYDRDCAYDGSRTVNEINCANSIHPEMIIGVYNVNQEELTVNPQYRGRVNLQTLIISLHLMECPFLVHLCIKRKGSFRILVLKMTWFNSC